MKRLTLDETWRLCLKQWRWIAKQIRNGSTLPIETLKRHWVNYHCLGEDISGNCFFCEYFEQSGSDDEHCDKCPGKKIDPDFSCANPSYHYEYESLKFLKEVERLNKIRKGRKKC